MYRRAAPRRTEEWNLDEFLAGRVERGRRLLAESADHQGSTDLQHFLADADDTVAFHRIFLALGRRTEEQEQQGLLLFLRSAMHKLQQPFHITVLNSRCCEAMEQAAARMQSSGHPGLGLLGGLIVAAIGIVEQPESLAQAPLSTQREVAALLSVELWGTDVLEAVRSLERHQRSASFGTILSASDLKLTASLLRLHAAKHQHPHPAHSMQTSCSTAVAQSRAAGLAACRHWEALQPGTAAVLMQKGTQLAAQPTAAAAAAFRAALQAARQEAAHSVVAAAALSLAFNLAMGAEGGSWSLSEVQGLLDESKRAQALCKGWLPKPGVQSLQQETSLTEQVVQMSALLHPGQDRMPAALDQQSIEEGPVAAPCHYPELPLCSGCGEAALQLRKCSACRVTAYCSRECQVDHWRKGGHKRECAQLAALGRMVRPTVMQHCAG